jgi:small neutral amino acid transporter SnatA (MarC family)
MNHTSINLTLVIDTFLLLLIWIGPKIALVPFLEVTGDTDPSTKQSMVRKMLTTAGIVAVLLIVLAIDVAVFRWANRVSSRAPAHPLTSLSQCCAGRWRSR